MIIDGKEWRLVPVEAVREMLDAAHFGPNCAEEGLSASDEKFWIDVWNAMLNSAPQPPEVVVTEEARVRVIRDMISGLPSVRYNRGDVAEAYLLAWQRELGPHLGLVPREDVARVVEAAYRECASELCHYDTALVDQWWAESDARKRLEGGR